jgi:FkbM family methyltransferase
MRRLILAELCWRGILVEPQSRVVDRLKTNYAGHGFELVLLNCARSDVFGEMDIHYIREDMIAERGLPGWYAELASFDLAVIQEPLDDLVANESPAMIKMDVEGGEEEAISGALACVS